MLFYLHNSRMQSLQYTRISGSTSRVIDVPRLIDRFEKKCANDVRPVIFQTKILNNAIIIKHVIMTHERMYFIHRRPFATKIVLPFARINLNLGGYTVFIDEHRSIEKIMSLIGLREVDDALGRDQILLSILNDIPSFDPFLITERARLEGINLPIGLIDLSDRDLIELRHTVARSLAQIASLALPGASVEGSLGLASAFLESRDRQRLDPLRVLLRMDSEEFFNSIYFWKGIFYYEWKLDNYQSFFDELVISLSDVKPVDRCPESMKIIRMQIRNIIRNVNISIVVLSQALRHYKDAMSRFVEGRDPKNLVILLKNSKAVFERVRDHSSLLNHYKDFWEYAIRDANWRKMPSETAIDILKAFSTSFPEDQWFLDA